MNYLIAGTGVTPVVGGFYYRKMLQRLDAELICLPGFGLRYGVYQCAEKIMEWLEWRHIHNANEIVESDELTLIGHSQGGLVALALQDMSPTLISKVVTLGAPLAGSQWASKHSPLPAVRDMAPNSEFLRGQWHRDSNLHIYLSRDALVLPYSSEYKGVVLEYPAGHISACWDNDVVDQIASWVI